MSDAPSPQSALLGQLLHRAKMAEAVVNTALAGLGLSLPKWTALATLAGAGQPLTLTQLADRLTCVRSNVTQLVDRLEAEGLVRRTADPADRRAIRAELTELGWQRFAAGQAVVVGSAQQVFHASSPADMELLGAIFERMG